jgi:hypothetical protein
MECHLSLLNQTKIDQAKNQQSFTSFVYKNADKILKTRKADFSGRQLSQVASTYPGVLATIFCSNVDTYKVGAYIISN